MTATTYADFRALMEACAHVWPTWAPHTVLQEIKSELASAGCQNVLLGGNYVAGVALGKCVEFSYDFAADIASQLKVAK